MSVPNTNWSEITTTTLFNRSRKLADNVTKNNALLRRLSQKGKVKPFDGGQAIVQELEYSENGYKVAAAALLVSPFAWIINRRNRLREEKQRDLKIG